MSSTGKIQRDIREVVHDEMIMKDRIAKILKEGPRPSRIWPRRWGTPVTR